MAQPDFSKPTEVTDVDMAFGGQMEKLLPSWDSIPEQFRRYDGTPFNWVVDRWFGSGLPGDTEFEPKDGIDPKTALRHVGAVLRSWEPKHEHKVAGCAYLLSLWFESIKLPEAA